MTPLRWVVHAWQRQRAKRVLANAFWHLKRQDLKIRKKAWRCRQALNDRIDLFNARCVIYDAELRVYGLPPDPDFTRWES